MRKISLVWFLTIPLVAACTDAGLDTAAVAVRDSAGVVIIENARPEWADGAEWRVAAEPDLSIGAVAGEDAYLLDRVAHALRQSNGRIVVFNGGTQELRYYDAGGGYLYSVGGRGDGPGEFQGARRLFRAPGDSLVVADGIAGRLSLLDPDGGFVRSHNVGWGRASPSGRLADGRMVHLTYADPELAVAVGHVRVPLHLLLFAPERALEDTAAVLPGGDEYRVEVQGGISNYDVPFGRQQNIAVAGDRIYSGLGEVFEVEVRRADGVLESLIRAAVRPRSVRPEDLERWRRGLLERASERSRPAVERVVRDAPVPATMPAYSAFRVDAEGNLWVRVYAPPGEPAVTWRVFDPRGRWLGEVDLPEGLDVTEIGADYLLGIVRDELDVEYVRLYRIEKPSR